MAGAAMIQEAIHAIVSAHLDIRSVLARVVRFRRGTRQNLVEWRARRWVMAVGAQAKNSPKKRRHGAAADPRAVSETNGVAKRPITKLEPIIELAAATFRQELPELLRLRTARRQWVAYEGSRRLGFGANKLGTFQEVRRTGSGPRPPVLAVYRAGRAVAGGSGV
jgi:hypothetical protein